MSWCNKNQNGFWNQNGSAGQPSSPAQAQAQSQGAQISCVQISPAGYQGPAQSSNSDNNLPAPSCGQFCAQQPAQVGNQVCQNVKVVIPGGKITHQHRKFDNQPITIPAKQICVPGETVNIPAQTYNIQLKVTIPGTCVTTQPKSVTVPAQQIQPPCIHHCEPDCHYPSREVCIQVPLNLSQTAAAGSASVVAIKELPSSGCNPAPAPLPCNGGW